MGSLTNYGETTMADIIFNNTRSPGSHNSWLALCSSEPDGETATIGALAELSGGSYARQIFFAAVEATRIYNLLEIEVPVASSDWVTATHWAWLDRSSPGSWLGVWATGALATARTVHSGTRLTIAAHELEIELGGVIAYTNINNMLNTCFYGTSGLGAWNPTALALCTANVSGDTIPAEPGNTYARQVIAPYGGSAPTWTQAANGVVSNAQTITFPLATASWGTIQSVVAIASGRVTAYVNGLGWAIGNGDQVSFAPGQLAFTVT